MPMTFAMQQVKPQPQPRARKGFIAKTVLRDSSWFLRQGQDHRSGQGGGHPGNLLTAPVQFLPMAFNTGQLVSPLGPPFFGFQVLSNSMLREDIASATDNNVTDGSDPKRLRVSSTSSTTTAGRKGKSRPRPRRSPTQKAGWIVRPRGRAPKDKRWDEVIGRWMDVPAEKASVAATAAIAANVMFGTVGSPEPLAPPASSLSVAIHPVLPPPPTAAAVSTGMLVSRASALHAIGEDTGAGDGSENAMSSPLSDVGAVLPVALQPKSTGGRSLEKRKSFSRANQHERSHPKENTSGSRGGTPTAPSPGSAAPVKISRLTLTSNSGSRGSSADERDPA